MRKVEESMDALVLVGDSDTVMLQLDNAPLGVKETGKRREKKMTSVKVNAQSLQVNSPHSTASVIGTKAERQPRQMEM